MSEPKYPQIEVQLSGEDGNAFFIMWKVGEAMRKAKVPQADITAFNDEAMSGNYDHLLQTCMRLVKCS